MTTSISSPQTDAEFERYFDLRWQVLRAPWGQPRGSERDEWEDAAAHAVIWDDNGAALAVGRMHLNSPDEAQIRYMAVAESARGTGLGRQIVEYLERSAREQGARRVVLNARDDVAGFYARMGYEVVGDGPTLFGSVVHRRMSKTL